MRFTESMFPALNFTVFMKQKSLQRIALHCMKPVEIAEIKHSEPGGLTFRPPGLMVVGIGPMDVLRIYKDTERASRLSPLACISR